MAKLPARQVVLIENGLSSRMKPPLEQLLTRKNFKVTTSIDQQSLLEATGKRDFFPYGASGIAAIVLLNPEISQMPGKSGLFAKLQEKGWGNIPVLCAFTDENQAALARLDYPPDRIITLPEGADRMVRMLNDLSRLRTGVESELPRAVFETRYKTTS